MSGLNETKVEIQKLNINSDDAEVWSSGGIHPGAFSVPPNRNKAPTERL